MNRDISPPQPPPDRKKRKKKSKPKHKKARAKKTDKAWNFFPQIGDLTEQDLRTLDWINRYVVSIGYPPSVRELCKARGLKGTKAGYKVLYRLEAYGFLDVDPGVTRGIRIHNLPQPTEQGVARLKLWLSEGAGILRKLAPEDPKVKDYLNKISVIAF